MLQEIPLLDEERAAVEDGVAAMTKLADGLRDVAMPDGRTPAEIPARFISYPVLTLGTALTRSLY